MNFHSNDRVCIVLHVAEFDEDNATYKRVMSEKVATFRGRSDAFTLWSREHNAYVRVFVGVRCWNTGENLSLFLVTAKQLSKKLSLHGIDWHKKARKW